MKKTFLLGAVAFAAARSFAGLYGDTPDAKHAWSVHDWLRPKPAKVTAEPGLPPSDAVVLFDGTRASFEKNWCDAKGNAPTWTFDEKLGAFGLRLDAKKRTGKGNIFTRARFGDCQLHLEYRHDPRQLLTDRGPQMRGNSGVFIMGKYEIQVLESFHTSREAEGKGDYVDNYTDGQAGSVYAENPPQVNPARPAGEWQVYDIVFHQPIWKDGRLLHPGSVTVFFNGVVVQDHWEMEGLTTHCKRRPLAPHETEGQLSFQDHGCEVSFRNVWYRPLPSRWANLTHSTMSADPAAVKALRNETAARLFRKIDPAKRDAATLNALFEVVGYSMDEPYQGAMVAAARAFRAKLEAASPEELDAMKGDILSVAKSTEVLRRNGVLTDKCKLSAKLAEIKKAKGWK